MGYYLDLYLRDNSKLQSREALVEAFCANGCKRHFDEAFPDWVEVRCPIPEFNDFFLITFQEAAKDPPQDRFADIRIGSSPHRNWYTAFFTQLLKLGNKLDFYVHDGLLNIELSAENMEHIIDNAMYGNSKLRDLLGGIER